MREEYARYLLEKVKSDFNEIADIFDQKQRYLPPDFKILKKYINKGNRILDIGCGNGRFKEIVVNVAEYYGTDVSEKLLEIAKKRYPDGKFFLTESLSLPFEDDFFDKVFCLAVFHHIPSVRFRIEFLQEIKRVLKKQGKLILTIWNLGDSKKVKRLLFKYTILKAINKTELGFRDIYYPWKDSKGDIVVNRYVHVFSEKELARIIKKAGFMVEEVKILPRSAKESNILVVAQA